MKEFILFWKSKNYKYIIDKEILHIKFEILG